MILNQWLVKFKERKKRKFRRQAQSLFDQVAELRSEVTRTHKMTTDMYLDAMLQLRHDCAAKPFNDHCEVVVETDHPVAVHSLDHKQPRGAAKDFTRCPRFQAKCAQLFGKGVRFLDLGCSQGGLVLDFALRGQLSVGIEGSDYPLVNQLGAWPIIPEHLFTADITHPFSVRDRASGQPIEFDVINASEVMEHLEESQLSMVFENIARHLAPEEIFCASISTVPDVDSQTGTNWHRTVQSRDWWVKKAHALGFSEVTGLLAPRDHPRGTGREWYDADYVQYPEFGFHVVWKKH